MGFASSCHDDILVVYGLNDLCLLYFFAFADLFAQSELSVIVVAPSEDNSNRGAGQSMAFTS